VVSLPLPSAFKDIAAIGQDVVHGAEYVGHAIVTHPIESAIIAGGTAAVAAGTIFTFGANAPAAPEEEAAVIGAAEGADIAGADIAASEGAAAADAATDGTASTLSQAGSTVINGAAKGAAGLLKYGLTGAGIGLAGYYVSGAIANAEKAIVGGVNPQPYPSPIGILTGGSNGGAGGLTQTTQTSTPPSLVSSLLSSPLTIILIVAAVGLLLYGGYKSESSKGS